jgi:hypothetical protein
MVLAGDLTEAAAQHVHHAAAAEAKKAPVGATYKPKALNDHEWATVRRLADMIVPAEEGGSPGALQAGAPEFIDLLCSGSSELTAIYTGGLLWLDVEMKKRYGATFVEAKPAEQTAMLDLLAYRKNSTPEVAAGVRFFAWIRRMVVDAYYTSPVGVKDLGYKGNVGMSKFQVPAEALQYALKRSPV